MEISREGAWVVALTMLFSAPSGSCIGRSEAAIFKELKG